MKERVPLTVAAPVASSRGRANTGGMRQVTLSDHNGGELAAARAGREAADTADRRQYERDLAAFERPFRDARDRRGEYWSQRRLLLWLREALTLRRLHRTPPPRPPAPREPDREEQRREAGVEAERAAAAALADGLDESWVLLTGYRNPRGEIDGLLLGPGGLFAVEVKNRNGTFTITRDRWAYVKYDNYGNVVDRGEVTDDGGRPPHVQLTEPLQSLERFLAKSGRPVRFHPVVLLSHPKAMLGRVADGIGVDVLIGAGELLGLAQRGGAVLAAAEVSAVEQLVIRDHRHHAARRGNPPGGKPWR
jgi:hypothetical protein